MKPATFRLFGRLFGFSLLEVMVSSSMLIAGLTGIVAAIATTTTQQAHQRHISRALSIAESTLEELLILGVASPDLGPGAHPATPREFDDEGDRLLSGTGRYHVTWNVGDGPPAVPLMRTVTVTVGWTENTSSRQFSLTTIRR